MERRVHPRTPTNFEGRMINLRTSEQAPWGRVCDMSKSGLSTVLPLQSVPDDLIQLEMADSVLLGRVVYSIPEGSQFRTGITLERVRIGDSDVANLLQEILRQTMPGTPGVERSEIYIG